MNPARETARQFVGLCTHFLDLTPPDRASLLRFLVTEGRKSKRAFETVREVYQLVATHEWQPAFDDLKILVYAPLDNPALIPEIRRNVERILDSYPNQRQLRSDWRYVQTFSPDSKREWQIGSAQPMTDQSGLLLRKCKTAAKRSRRQAD
jgi:hypothetical protein